MDLLTITSSRPGTATGVARRLRDGTEIDRAVFAYSAPGSWRVRHDDGRQIVAQGGLFWDRSHDGGAWERHDPLPGVTGVHHNGFLVGMLLPGRFGVLTDAGTTVGSQEFLRDGTVHLTGRSGPPDPVTLELWWHPDRYLSRFRFDDHGVVHTYEMAAEIGAAIEAAVFTPEHLWPPSEPGGPATA
ncbi:hypothetical protein [Cellulomonas hominis]